MFRRSSAVEQLTVNQLAVGSIPTAGAKSLKDLKKIGRVARRALSLFYWESCVAYTRGARIQKRAIRLVEAKSNPMHRPSQIPSAPRPKVKPNSALVGIPTPQ